MRISTCNFQMFWIASLVATLQLVNDGLSAAEEDLPGPWLMRAGWAPFAPGVRDLVGHSAWTLGGGYVSAQPGLAAPMGIDVDLRYAHQATGSIVDLGVTYVERIPWQNQVYGGYGAGLWAFRLTDERPEGEGPLWGLRPGLKALVGYQFAVRDADFRSALEFALMAVAPAHGFTTSGLSVDLVIGF